MNIEQHIKQSNMTQAEYADAVGISRMSLSRILSGQRPGQKTAHKLVNFSGGKVTYNEIYSAPISE